MTTRQILWLIIAILSSFQIGLQLGRLLTLWQEKAKNRNHERKHREDEVTDIK